MATNRPLTATRASSPIQPPATSGPAARVEGLGHRYGQRQALDGVSLTVARGEIFAVLGPNGGGKTTLFRILSTLVPPQTGAAEIAGCSLPRETAEARRRIGVVFQAASVDRKLTVLENIRCQAALYGLAGADLEQRIDRALDVFSLSDRRNELAESLSGGLRRRVELAKGMIHGPEVLLLDEPSTGLDPGARCDLWRFLRQLRDEQGTTVVFTSHLLEEAESADRIAILHAGRLVALDAPDALRSAVGGDTLVIQTAEPAALAAAIAQQFPLSARVVDGDVRLEVEAGHAWIARLVEAFPGAIASIRLGKPTLEDVFIARTGHRFWQGETPA